MQKEKFNQIKYINQWKKENMRSVSSVFKTDFVLEFKEACKKLNLKQSDVFRKAMQDTINKAK